MVSPDLVNKLVIEAHNRFGKLHRTPSIAAISVEEMTTLRETYETSVLLESFRRTGSCIKKEPTMTHDRIIRAVYNLADRVLSQDTRRAQAAPKPAPIPVPPKPRPEPKVDIDALRLSFQERNTYSGDWTLGAEDVEELLKVHTANDIRAAFSELGRFDSDYKSQERCFARLQELLDSLAWQSATGALTQ